jgi:uncharacterized membrane protein YkvA (DUF1232 family)
VPVRDMTMLDRWRLRAKQLGGETYALYLAFRHPRVPWYAKVFVGVVVAYALSPIDLIPDFVPVVGYLDDLLLVPAGIALALKMVPDPVMVECRSNAQELMAQGELTSRFAAGPIVLIWLVCIALVAAALARLVKK